MSPVEVDMDLVVVSAAELGIPTETSLADVYARAQEHGLALAPAEVGPQLRLQYFDQPIGEFLHVGMNPINTWSGEPVIFVLVNGGAGLILIGQDGGTNAKVSAASRFWSSGLVYWRRSRRWFFAETAQVSVEMSALGHKRTFRGAIAMSALPPKADIIGRKLNVRYGPKADIRRRAAVQLLETSDGGKQPCYRADTGV